jgi:sulfide:quinone oxidoreductase
MKNLAIIGAGAAGTMVANHLRRELPADWTLTVIDPAPEHLYQPGLLFLPFGARDEAKIRRQRTRTLGRGVEWVQRPVERVDTGKRKVVLKGADPVPYDLLVIASGSHLHPEETPGLMGNGWRHNVHDFYTLEGALKLRDALADFKGGRLVLNVAEMPIKCPVAPMEFLFLADAFFRKRRMRGRVELVYATPLDGAFTKPVCNIRLSHLLKQKGINLETEFGLAEVDSEGRKLVSYDERHIDYDLLVSIPIHMGAEFIGASGLGNEMNFVPTDKQTLQVKGHDHIFALGDATDLPSSKAGSVAHFQSGVLTRNILRAIRGQSLAAEFDGHANCFIETGFGKALMIDFNYDVQPLPGKFPVPGGGPFTLLGESRINHLGKLAFRWLYWNFLMPSRQLPISDQMSMAGKQVVTEEMMGAAA